MLVESFILHRRQSYKNYTNFLTHARQRDLLILDIWFPLWPMKTSICIMQTPCIMQPGVDEANYLCGCHYFSALGGICCSLRDLVNQNSSTKFFLTFQQDLCTVNRMARDRISLLSRQSCRAAMRFRTFYSSLNETYSRNYWGKFEYDVAECY